jgi:very-short-patch-repair endonuclease
LYDEQWQQLVEKVLKSTSITVERKRCSQDGFQDSYQAPIEWGGMFFRSQAELKLAEALDRRQVLFFANIRGRISSHQAPISDRSQFQNGRIELDFFVLYQGKYMVLEVDGKHHAGELQKHRDYVRDRLLLKEGIVTVRFTAQECLHRPDDVITEFLNLFYQYDVN